MRKIITLLLLCFGLSTAYAQVEFVATNGENITMKRSHTTRKMSKLTRVYFDKNDVPDSLEQIGYLSVHGNDRAECINKAKIYSARAYGTAILIIQADDQTSGQKLAQRFVMHAKAFKGKYYFYVYRPKKK